MLLQKTDNIENSDWESVEAIATQVNLGKLKAGELVERSLKLMADNDSYNAIISTTAERARQRAKEVDLLIAEGKNAGKLAGVPFIAKDNFLAFGADTTAGSNILKGFVAPYQATAIERLEAEGAICVAKANLDAFAHGGSTENSDFGPTKNPYDKSKVAGGSSGGSAAAVALGFVPFALGTDTGGSIREPASFCGVVGYKPTYGLVSRYGVVAMASSTDVVGPIANSVEDIAYVLDVLAGRDSFDSTTIEREKSYKLSPNQLIKPKVGLIKEFMGDGVDEGVKKVINAEVNRLKKMGYDIEEVSLPSIGLALACYYIIVPAEVSSNLSRYDGQRYGFSNQSANNLEESYKLSRGQGFNAENKRRIIIGTYVLSSGYYDAFYKKAALVRTKLINEFQAAFKKFDFLIGPTVPTTAPKIGENTDDPLKMYLLDIMTVAVNLVGVPAISLPVGQVSDLPVGLQIIGQLAKDGQLLNFAHQIHKGGED